MAAAVRMMSLAREELPVVANELAATARASTTAAVESGATMAARAGEKEVMNPVAVRHMAEMSVKEAAESSSLLGQHLSITRSALQHPPTGQTTSLLETLSTTVETTLTNPASSGTSTTTSIIAQTLEQDMGVSIKEAISNAGQTGIEEVVEEMGDTAKALLAGRGGNAPAAALKPAPTV